MPDPYHVRQFSSDLPPELHQPINIVEEGESVAKSRWDAWDSRARAAFLSALYPAVPHDLAMAALHVTYPAWLLTPDGVITSMNQLASWLWQAKLGENAFTAFGRAYNSNRIALPEKHGDEESDFPRKKSSVVKRKVEEADARIQAGQQSDPTPYLSFIAAMRSHPILREIYEWTPKNQEREWDYLLKIMTPDDASSEYLRFDVTVFQLDDGDRVSGYLALYRPIGTSTTIIKRKYYEVVEQCGIIDYVLSISEGGEYSTTKERYIDATQSEDEGDDWNSIPEDEEYWRNELGPYLTREQVQQRLGITKSEALAALIQEGKVLELPTSQGPAYPAFQFRGTRGLDPTISRVIGILNKVVATPYTTASWIKGSNPDLLDRKTPLQWLERHRRHQDVIDAAERLARRWSR